MRKILDRFILGIPRLYIKQFPYAWIFLVALWHWPPGLVWIFLLIIVLGLLLTAWQQAAWVASLRDAYAPHGEKFYVDRPPVAVGRAARNILILLVAAVAVAFFVNGQIGLTVIQTFLLVVGFSLLYRNSLFFGAPTTYVITASGLGIYFAPTNPDYRLFLKFDEIARIERCAFQKDQGWDCFARTRAADGLLLLPKDPNGLTKRIEKLFIVPTDIEKFRAQLPARLGS
jgi:hypothetical protein